MIIQTHSSNVDIVVLSVKTNILCFNMIDSLKSRTLEIVQFYNQIYENRKVKNFQHLRMQTYTKYYNVCTEAILQSNFLNDESDKRKWH